MPSKRRTLSAPQLIALSFAGLVLAGGLLLSLPAAVAPGQSISFLDALFTSTSAICVTGLIVVDTPVVFSTFGQAIILLLIQIGGLGYMSISTILAAAIGREHLAAGAADSAGGIECAKPRRRGPLYADRSEADAGVRAHRRRDPRDSVVAGVRAGGALARPLPFGVRVQQCRLRPLERQPDAVARRCHRQSRDHGSDHRGRTGVLRHRRAARPAAPPPAAVAAYAHRPCRVSDPVVRRRRGLPDSGVAQPAHARSVAGRWSGCSRRGSSPSRREPRVSIPSTSAR